MVPRFLNRILKSTFGVNPKTTKGILIIGVLVAISQELTVLTSAQSHGPGRPERSPENAQKKSNVVEALPSCVHQFLG